MVPQAWLHRNNYFVSGQRIKYRVGRQVTMIIFWQLKQGNMVKSGWCHNQPIDQAVQAIVYQSGLSREWLKRNNASVVFKYRNAIDLGSYYFDCDEFYPSTIYDDCPDILANVQL